jgi:opacity protein-like surface antigen
MRRILAAALLGLALAAAATVADDAAEAAAEKSAQAWLAEVDGGNYGASWDHAAELFRNAVTKEVWKQQLGAVRGPLGAVGKRTLRSTTFTRSLPGAPDGEYVVIQYDTSFANKTSAIETVTPMRDPDGVWRVSGYYIR